MSDPQATDLSVQWNEDYYREWALVDPTSGLPIDLTGCSVAMQVRANAGLTSAALLTATCAVIDAPNGVWSESIPKAALQAAVTANASPQATVTWAYDVRITDDAGTTRIWRVGQFIIQPGVTQ